MDPTKARVIAAVFVGAFVLLVLGQRSCDRSGYWPHREESRVYMGGSSWPDGEERKCLALPREDGTIFFLGCADAIENFDQPQLTTVTYWGKTQREDRFQALHSQSMDAWRWSCKKSGSSLTCYAVN